MRALVYLFIALGSISVVAQEATSEDYIRKYHKIAIDEMHAYGIPAVSYTHLTLPTKRIV